MKPSYSSQLTSCTPIQKGESATSWRGPSHASRSGSSSGLPIRKRPPGSGTIWNVAPLLAIRST